MLPAHAVRREADAGRFRLWTVEPALARTVYLAQPTDRSLSHAATVVEALVRAVLRDLVRSGAWAMARTQVSG